MSILGFSLRRETSTAAAFVRIMGCCAYALVSIGVLLGGTTSLLSAENNSTASGGMAKTGDLTGLSLQELYNLDIVQPNVLGGHTHPGGEIMFGYHYMHMNMEDIYQNSRTLSPAEVFAQGFPTIHITMEMDMHMFEAMYAPTERLTFMAMLPYKQMSMLHQTSAGHRFTQNADGIGDLEVMGLFTVFGDIRQGGHRLILNAGISFPTGSINVRDHAMGDPSMPLVQLEYPMQLGSGTYDLMPGITYLGDAGRWSWGAQTIETIHLGRNDAGYRFGDQYRLSAWAAYGVTDWCAPSIRLDGRWWENIKGSDARLAANPTPEARTDLQGGRRLDLLFGINFYMPGGWAKGNRFMVEGGLPVYQHLDGPQLGVSWMLSAGWSYAF
jgi:hypothetical protein